jgi:hypothetical protein
VEGDYGDIGPPRQMGGVPASFSGPGVPKKNKKTVAFPNYFDYFVTARNY